MCVGGGGTGGGGGGCVCANSTEHISHRNLEIPGWIGAFSPRIQNVLLIKDE